MQTTRVVATDCRTLDASELESSRYRSSSKFGVVQLESVYPKRVSLIGLLAGRSGFADFASWNSKMTFVLTQTTHSANHLQVPCEL
jgi:hypothetical protein